MVHAFSGLFAPYWRSDARGAIVGLTRCANKGHLARAVLEATAYQTREILDAMSEETGRALSSLKVDGGMVCNGTLMQFQTDILGIPVIGPSISETTALGAARSGSGRTRRNCAPFGAKVANGGRRWTKPIDGSFSPDGKRL